HQQQQQQQHQHGAGGSRNASNGSGSSGSSGSWGSKSGSKYNSATMPRKGLPSATGVSHFLSSSPSPSSSSSASPAPSPPAPAAHILSGPPPAEHDELVLLRRELAQSRRDVAALALRAEETERVAREVGTLVRQGVQRA